MQTFLPFADFAASARVLDRQRLGKQRVEVLQLLKALAGETKGWANHPACLMWLGHEGRLVYYGLAICNEWVERGYKDTCAGKIAEIGLRFNASSSYTPAWMGDEAFHSSHRAVLLGKDPEHYGQFGWAETPAVPDAKGSYKDTYVWPVSSSV